MAGESGPGPNENDEYVGPRDGYRRITSNLPRSHEGTRRLSCVNSSIRSDVRTDAEHDHRDADRAEHARRLHHSVLSLGTAREARVRNNTPRTPSPATRERSSTRRHREAARPSRPPSRARSSTSSTPAFNSAAAAVPSASPR